VFFYSQKTLPKQIL